MDCPLTHRYTDHSKHVQINMQESTDCRATAADDDDVITGDGRCSNATAVMRLAAVAGDDDSVEHEVPHFPNSRTFHSQK